MIVEIVLLVVIKICLFVIGFSIFMLYRNERVFEHVNKSIETIFSYEDYGWRLKVMNSVPYDEMVNKFWKPLDSFHEDKSFLQPKK